MRHHGVSRLWPGLPAMALGMLAAALGGCGLDLGGSFRTGATTPVALAKLTAKEPVLSAEGICEGDTGHGPAGGAGRVEVALGIGECELVRLKGKPTDVLVGESGKGQREAQVLYSEPTGREIYLFTDNRLTRIVKPGQG